MIRLCARAEGQSMHVTATRRFARSMLSRSAPCACVSGSARQGRDRRGRARWTGGRGNGSGRDIQSAAAAARIVPISSGGGREAGTGGAARQGDAQMWIAPVLLPQYASNRGPARTREFSQMKHDTRPPFRSLRELSLIHI